MSESEKYALWKNEEMSLEAAYNPSIPRSEGFHVVLLQKKKVPAPWADPELYSRMSLVVAKASAVMMELGMADWINIHCDGNIGAAAGKPVMHIHILGRLKSSPSWGGPLDLPGGDRDYGNEPLRPEEIERLRSALVGRL